MLVHPAQQSLGEHAGLGVIVERRLRYLRRIAAPGVDVEKFLQVAPVVALGRFGDGSREIAVMGVGVTRVRVLGLGLEKTGPFAVNAFDQGLRQRMVLQHRKTGLVQAGGEGLRRVIRREINDGQFGTHKLNQSRINTASIFWRQAPACTCMHTVAGAISQPLCG